MDDNLTFQPPTGNAVPNAQPGPAQPGPAQPGPAQPGPAQPSVNQARPANQQTKPKKKKKTNGFLTFVLWLVMIVVVVILGLIISAYIAGFSSVFEMINWIIAQVQH